MQNKNLLEYTIDQIVRLDQATLDILLQLFKPLKWDKHSFLAKAGEYSRKIAFVEQGVLRAFYQNEEGEQYNKTFFVEGQFVGAYSSLVTGLPNQIYIQCLTDCKLLMADYQAFTNLYDVYPKIERIARRLAEFYFVQKEKREIELVTLEAKDRYRIFREEHQGLEQRIAQYHIASYLGVSATQLSRIRAKK